MVALRQQPGGAYAGLRADERMKAGLDGMGAGDVRRTDAAGGAVLRSGDIAFEGVRLGAAPVLQRTTLRPDLGAPTVMVVGSAIETTGRGPAFHSDSMAPLIGELTRALAARGLNMVTCSSPGLQDRVAAAYAGMEGRGFVLDLVVTPHPGSDNAFGAYAPEGFRAHGDVTIHCGMPFEILGCLAAQICDIVVVVSGGLGSVIETSIAAMRECPIIAFADTGGSAELIAGLLTRFKSSNRGLDVCEVRTDEQFERELARLVVAFRGAGRRSGMARVWPDLERVLAGPQC